MLDKGNLRAVFKKKQVFFFFLSFFLLFFLSFFMFYVIWSMDAEYSFKKWGQGSTIARGVGGGH